MSVYIIAEAAINHFGDMTIAKEMIDKAKEAGTNAIKFQHHLPDEEMLKDVPMSDNFSEPLYEILNKYNLTLDEHITLKKYCDKVNIDYLCTPFSLKAAIEINELVSMFKIGSGEFTDIPMLKEIAKIGKPIILSTGMSTLREILMIKHTLYPINRNLIFMNCTSEYPPIYEDINLNMINTLKDILQCKVGHSDHTPDIYTSIAAVCYGAEFIEKHFILDKTMPGPDASVSLEPNQLRDLVDGIRKVEKAMIIKEKIVYTKEKQIRKWARRSIVTIQNIKKGDKFTTENIWSKRPGTGIQSYHLEEIIGKHAHRDIEKDVLLDRKDIE